MSHDVVITFDSKAKCTIISIDGVEQKQVVGYMLQQNRRTPLPKFSIIQHDGNIDPVTNSWDEVTREFTPRSITYTTI